MSDPEKPDAPQPVPLVSKKTLEENEEPERGEEMRMPAYQVKYVRTDETLKNIKQLFSRAYSRIRAIENRLKLAVSGAQNRGEIRLRLIRKTVIQSRENLNRVACIWF